jgi:hypothetical protein
MCSCEPHSKALDAPKRVILDCNARCASGPVPMDGPGVYQPYLGRSISIINVKELRGQELHVILHVLDTLNTCWYIYRRPEAAPPALVADGFGTETDPDGHTRLLSGDGRSPSIIERDNPEQFRHLPNLVLMWLWMGLSLTQITMRYIPRHPRTTQVARFTHLEAQWGGNFVRAFIDQGFIYYLGKEDVIQDFQELVFDQNRRNWCLPLTLTPLPRHVAQWLAAEAYRLGMDQLDLAGAL